MDIGGLFAILFLALGVIVPVAIIVLAVKFHRRIRRLEQARRSDGE